MRETVNCFPIRLGSRPSRDLEDTQSVNLVKDSTHYDNLIPYLPVIIQSGS